MDELVDKDMQTEDLGKEDKFNQAPEDEVGSTYESARGVRVTNRQAKNEANLEKFISRAGPLVEQILDDNEQVRFLENRQNASKKNAVESKEKLRFPEELLQMLGT